MDTSAQNTIPTEGPWLTLEVDSTINTLQLAILLCKYCLALMQCAAGNNLGVVPKVNLVSLVIVMAQLTTEVILQTTSLREVIQVDGERDQVPNKADPLLTSTATWGVKQVEAWAQRVDNNGPVLYN
jgi:hypothetical protein